MSLIRYHKRNSLIWKIIYLSAIGAILITLLSLLNIESIFVSTKDINKKIPQNHSAKDKVQNTELTLQNSIFKGVTQDLEPYEITASTASKLSENKYALDDVGANYLIGDSNLFINAKNGLLDNLNNRIELSDDVQILFNNLLLNTSEIHLNLVNKDVMSKTSVKATYKNSEINADSFTSKNNSDIINFKGNVKTILNLEDF